MAERRGEWAGLPLPIDGQKLVCAPQMPFAELLNQRDAPPPEVEGWRIRNSFWSRRWRAVIHLIERPDGKVVGNWEPSFHHIAHDLQTMGASDVWGVEQESRALGLLAGMIRHVQYKRYLLTGMFLEKSAGSGVTYVFRRLKPTVAIAPTRSTISADESCRILCALCMHPIAYYEGSWAGAMCPTDDVIAHLTLMRADEAMFWKRCNQHPPNRPEAGL